MIQAIRLRNFKAFRDQRIELAPLSLLAGLNSSGKSSVLQAIALLRQSFDEGLLADEGWLLNGPLVELGTGGDVLYEDAKDERLEISLEGASGTWSSAVEYAKDDDVLRAYQTSTAGLDQLLGPSFQYLRADRIEPMVHYRKAYQQVSRRRFLGCRGELAAHFLTIHRDEPVVEGLRHPSTGAAGLLAQTNAWLSELSLGVQLDVHEIRNTDFVRLGYSYGSGLTRTNERRPTHVGFGLSYVLPIITACLTTPPGGLILVENPEAHLHPRGQSAIGRLLGLAAKSGIQVLAETHSDHVLNGLRLLVKKDVLAPGDVSLLFFRKNPEGEVEMDCPRILPNGRLTHWPVDFFDEWDRSVEEILS